MKKIVLVGNPNVGKTALLNRITGASYNVGNWAGVTTTRQEGTFKTTHATIHVLDLPGLYSLIPCSEDENISVNEIFTDNYDLIINVIDSNNLQQNLMLTAELLELGIPMICVLNFYDEFQKKYSLDIAKLQDELGIPVIPTSAHTGEGIDKLIRLIDFEENYSSWISPLQITQQEEYQQLHKLFPLAESRYHLSGISPKINPHIIYTYISQLHPSLIKKFALNNFDLEKIIEQNQQIPDYTEDLLNKKEYITSTIPVISKPQRQKKFSFIKNIDNLILHPIFGYIFFGISMSVLFTMVFNMANPLNDFIDWLINEKITYYMSIILQGTAPELQSFIIDGLIRGVGGVLTFVPLIFVLYIFLAILEESGYLARVAILLEKPFSKIGLSGKSFFPMLLSFGCTVPAIYGTRVLETPAIRRLTAMLSSLISCGARLPVYALFIAAFFPTNGGVILLSLYSLGIFLAIIFAFILSKFSSFNSQNSCFVMVVPPYRFPNLNIVLKKAKLQASSYIQKAGTIIMGMLMLIWLVSYFPAKGDVSQSYIAQIGKKIQPLFVPLGFGDRWEPVVSIIPSLIAKESVVGFLGQVLAEDQPTNDSTITPKLSLHQETLEIGTAFFEAVRSSILGLVTWNFLEQFKTPKINELEEEGGSGIVERLRQIWTDKHAQNKAYSFMIFILLTLPCVTAMGVLKQELGFYYFFISFVFYLLLPFMASLIFYQVSLLF